MTKGQEQQRAIFTKLSMFPFGSYKKHFMMGFPVHGSYTRSTNGGNWLTTPGENDEGARAATRHFHQAVNVSIWLLQETFHDGFPRARELYQIDQWRKLV